MGRVAAIFDVDGTLLKGGSERWFFYYLWRQGRLKPRRLARFFLGLARHPGERFRDKSYLEGLSAADTEALARRCYRELLAPRLRPGGVAALRAHQAQGHLVVILTGTLRCVAQPLAEDLGADHLIATEPAVSCGRYTGELAGPHPRGPAKARLLEHLAAAEALDLQKSFAYGDALVDVPLLSLVGRPVAVNPGPGLRRLARRCGWTVARF